MPTKYYTDTPTFSWTNGTNFATTPKSDIVMVISPYDPVNNQHSGYYLQAKNFTIGNGEETDGSGVAATGTNIYENITDTWNVDTGVSKVIFQDIGTPGQLNNTVKATITISSTAPTADRTYRIDIDESSTNPIMSNAARTVCFFLRIPYDPYFVHGFYDPSVTSPTWTEIGTTFNGVTRTLLNESTYQSVGYYKYKFEGTITDYNASSFYDICRVLFRRANPSTNIAIDALLDLGSIDDPDFSTYNNYLWNFNPGVIDVAGPGSNLQYEDAYSISQSDPYFGYWPTSFGGASVNIPVPVAYHYDISVNPIDEGWAVEDEISGMCTLGHELAIFGSSWDPGDPEEVEMGVKSVQAPTEINYGAGFQNIVVHGDPNMDYVINVVSVDSFNTRNPRATNAYYNFKGRGGFQNTKCNNRYKIGTSGRVTHKIKFAKGDGNDAYYEIYITPIGETKLAENVPSFISPRRLTIRGAKSLSINGTATSGSFSTSGVDSSLRNIAVRSNRKTSEHTTIFEKNKTAVSSGARRIPLERANERITEDMIVTIPMSGSAIPHNTKVIAIFQNEIVINNATTATIAAGTKFRFDTNTTRIQPFQVVIPAGGTSGSFKNLTAIPEDNADYLPQHAIGGLYSSYNAVGSTSGSSTTVTLDSTKSVANALTGMVIRGEGISSSEGDYVKITANGGVGPFGGRTTAVTVAEAQTIAASTKLTITNHPTNAAVATNGIKLIHVHALVTTDGGSISSQESATIYGYLEINRLNNNVILPLHIETLLQSGGFS